MIVEKVETPKKIVEQKVIKNKKVVPQIVRQDQTHLNANVEIEKLDNLVAANIEAKKPAVKADERGKIRL